MGSSQQPPLDEIQWNHPPMVEQIGGITTNTVLPYFAESPFFDQTSNNAILTIQAFNNPNMYHLIQTREAFEGRLRTMQGLEFMVTHDPSENGTKMENTGVWVIGKQIRRKRQDAQDDVTLINSYYVVNNNIYMAPSVGNIIGSRMLSAVTSLTKSLSTASSLPMFTPAIGHSYLPPAAKNMSPGSSLQPTQSSKEGTPMLGASTPMPATQEITSSKGLSSSQSKSDIGHQGAQILEDSYNLSVRYANEYMDENPLVGEPGSFRLAKSKDSSLTSSMATTQSSQQSFKSSTPAPPPAPARDIPTPQLKTEDLPAAIKRPAKGAEKSPTSASPKEKKDKKERRKSKAPGAGETTTPKATTPKTTTPT